MRILKEGKLKEAQKVSYEDLFNAFPEQASALEDIREDFNRVYNVAGVRIVQDLGTYIDTTLNFVAACVLTGDDKYKIALEKFNKEVQEEVSNIVLAAKDLDKNTKAAIKLFDKLTKK